ncbi:hypothetical protein DD736_03675 [Helicobacter pylori]|nr:hypothetical protein DD736_03675 [Helicobacter pylori]
MSGVLPLNLSLKRGGSLWAINLSVIRGLGGLKQLAMTACLTKKSIAFHSIIAKNFKNLAKH